jgi:hypothetical protein
MNNPTLEVERFSVSSNMKDLKSVIEAVNITIRTDTLILANQQGIENPGIPQYGASDLLKKYAYRCNRVRPNWYRHTFKLKADTGKIITTTATKER